MSDYHAPPPNNRSKLDNLKLFLRRVRTAFNVFALISKVFSKIVALAYKAGRRVWHFRNTKL